MKINHESQKKEKPVALLTGVIVMGLLIGGMSLTACGKKDTTSNSKETLEISDTKAEDFDNKEKEEKQVEEITDKNENEDNGFEIYDAIINTPLIKLEDQKLKIHDQELSSDEYDFYSIGITALYGFDGSWKGGDDSYSLEGIDPEFYEIDRYDFLQVTQTDEETYDMDLEKYRSKFYYNIQYAVKKGENPETKLMECLDKEVVSISADQKMSRDIVSSGEAYPGDTLLITDEYGTEHYVVPLTAGGLMDSDTKGSYEICLAELGKYASLPDEDHNYSWDMEATANMSASFANCTYVKCGEENNKNNTIEITETYSNKINQMSRGTGIYSFWIQVNVTDDNKETLASGGDIHIKFNDVDLVIASEWGNE